MQFHRRLILTNTLGSWRARRGLIASALALALLLQLGSVAPAHADSDSVIAQNVAGTLPASGVFIGTWDGGSVEQIGVTQPQVGSVWVTANGKLVGYLSGAPAFVNTAFLQKFPAGQIPAGTPVLAVVGAGGSTTTPLPSGTTYSQATMNAFAGTLLRPSYQVSTCPGCWPEYNGTTIGVTTRWAEGTVLKVYVYSSTPADILALQNQLDAYQQRLGLKWQYAASPDQANVHVFMSFDRTNVPQTFPDWARSALASQNLVSGWSAFTRTSYQYSTGPNGLDPADRFDLEEAAVYVPLNQENGAPISRPLLDTNIRHELTHAIGWAEHWDVSGLLMSPAATGELELSALEWDMLRLLYDDAVEPGMWEAEVRAAVTITN
jgi:hypothetical protein